MDRQIDGWMEGHCDNIIGPVFQWKYKKANVRRTHYSIQLFQYRSYLILLENYAIYAAYGKCPKIAYTKAADKMKYANSTDPDQTAPEGAV